MNDYGQALLELRQNLLDIWHNDLEPPLLWLCDKATAALERLKALFW